MIRSTLLSVTCLAALATAACGGDDDGHDHDHDAPDAAATPDADPTTPDAAPREVITATQVLQPGELVEGVMHGTPADHAVIHLSAPTATMDWNIHGHADGSTQTVFEELDVMTVDYVFVPSAEADWWLLIRNGGNVDLEVTVQVDLHGDMTWSWE